MLNKDVKIKIVEDFRINPTDTGSADVQIAILTKEIELLNNHLEIHKHDFHSKRGLYQKIGQRRRLLKYLQNTESKRYRDLLEKLNLRK